MKTWILLAVSCPPLYKFRIPFGLQWDSFPFFGYNGQCCDKIYSVPSNGKKKKDLVTHPKDAYNFVFIQNTEPSVPVDGWGWGAGGRAAPLAYFSSRHWVNFRKTLGCADGNWITQVSSSEYLESWILSSCSPPKEVYLSKFTTRCH